MSARHTIALGLALAAFAASSGAHAQQAADVEQAKTLFAIGAQAYEKGDFLSAIQAFEEAERKAPRPAIVFSIAQAHRRQYYNDTTNTDHLRAAVAKYREYLAKAPDGTRRSDASQALAELGPAADRLAASDPRNPPPKQPARISINSTGTPGALISLDGAPPVDAPLIKPVADGPHRVVLSADGFVEETHSVTAVEGSIVAQDFPLKEKPAMVTVVTDSGARVEVDGRAVGTTPLAAVPIASGTHLVTVTRNGRDAAVRELELTRGQALKLDLPLRASGQRKAAIGVMIAGGVGVIAGATFTALAVGRESSARNILDASATRNLSSADLAAYQDALNARATWSGAAVIGYGAGAALLLTGALLYAFDSPPPVAPTFREKSDKSTKPDAPKRLEPSEIGWQPVLGPGAYGAALSGRF